MFNLFKRPEYEVREIGTTDLEDAIIKNDIKNIPNSISLLSGLNSNNGRLRYNGIRFTSDETAIYSSLYQINGD